jgi:S1-C subfamily serine protease
MDTHASSQPARTTVRSSSDHYRLPLLLLVLLVLATVAFLPTYLERVKYQQTRAELAAIRETLSDAGVGELGKLFTFVAKAVSPSVVHIETGRTVFRRDELSAILGPQILQQRGQASGVIVDPDGYIVTNYHVIANADYDNIKVKLPDGREGPARVVGDDAKNDLAVLKVDIPNLIPALWGDSNLLKAGEMVWALGNPFGLDNSLTFGIVSATARRGVNAEDRYSEYLQTDAAVNPGNSGGPLVNIKGEVIGINTAIVGPTFQGISFAIPSNVAKRIYEDIRKTGAVVNGFLGAELMPLTPQLANQLGIDRLEGALVVSVGDGTPAAKAGLEPGDFIISFDDINIEDPSHLVHLIARTQPGTKVKLKVLRAGKEVDVEVTVGRRSNRSKDASE